MRFLCFGKNLAGLGCGPCTNPLTWCLSANESVSIIVGVAVQKSATLSFDKSIVGTFLGVTHVLAFGRGPSGPLVCTVFGALQQPTSKKPIIINVFITLEYLKNQPQSNKIRFLLEIVACVHL